MSYHVTMNIADSREEAERASASTLRSLSELTRRWTSAMGPVARPTISPPGLHLCRGRRRLLHLPLRLARPVRPGPSLRPARSYPPSPSSAGVGRSRLILWFVNGRLLGAPLVRIREAGVGDGRFGAEAGRGDGRRRLLSVAKDDVVTIVTDDATWPRPSPSRRSSSERAGSRLSPTTNPGPRGVADTKFPMPAAQLAQAMVTPTRSSSSRTLSGPTLRPMSRPSAKAATTRQDRLGPEGWLLGADQGRHPRRHGPRPSCDRGSEGAKWCRVPRQPEPTSASHRGRRHWR